MSEEFNAEMDLSVLGLHELPQEEQEFLRFLSRGPAYLVYDLGFQGALINLRLLGLHFHCLAGVDNVALVVAGSAGRFDGGGLGEDDWILIFDKPSTERSYSQAQIDSLVQQIDGKQFKIHNHEFGPIELECRSIETGGTELCYSGSQVPFPDRIFGSEFFAGSRDVHRKARMLVGEAAASQKKIRTGILRDARRYLRVCETGVYRYGGAERIQFNLATGEVIYDPAKHAYGFKYGFLRFMQRMLEYEVFELLASPAIAVKSLVDLQPGFEERLRYMIRKRLVANQALTRKLGALYTELAGIQIGMKIRYYHNRAGTQKDEIDIDRLLEAREILSEWQASRILLLPES